MKILGKNIKIFGGGMGRIDYVIPKVKNKSVIDIGVVQHTVDATKADNWLHGHVAKHAKVAVGLDIHEKGIVSLRNSGYNVKLIDAHDFDIGECVDVIVAGDIIEHLHDLAGFFASIDRHLKDDGELVLLTANPWFFINIFRSLVGRVYENPEHTAWYTQGTITELLSRYNYKVTEFVHGSSEGFLKYLPLSGQNKHSSIWLTAKKHQK